MKPSTPVRTAYLCVLIMCIIVVCNTALNSSDKLPYYPPDNHADISHKETELEIIHKSKLRQFGHNSRI